MPYIKHLNDEIIDAIKCVGFTSEKENPHIRNLVITTFKGDTIEFSPSECDLIFETVIRKATDRG